MSVGDSTTRKRPDGDLYSRPMNQSKGAKLRAKPEGAKDRAFALVALALCVGCTGAGDITPVGPGTYMVQENTVWGRSVAAAEVAMKDAIAFCGRQGKTAIMRSEQIEPTPTGGAALVVFVCASPGDPEYGPPNLQPSEPTQEKKQ